MIKFPPTVILRHRKENLKKCSLSGLESRKDLLFFTYPIQAPLCLNNRYILLHPEGKELTGEDKEYSLFLIDGTWNYAEAMSRPYASMEKRSLPKQYKTAYPRTPNPEGGLASVEALYLAYLLLGREPKGLLDHYYWKDLFIEKNLLK